MIPSVPSGIRRVDGSALAGRPGGLLELALDPERIASGLALEGLRRDRTGAWWRGTEVELGRDAAGTVTVSGYGSDALRRRAGVVTGDSRRSLMVRGDGPVPGAWTTETGRLIEPVADERGWTAQVLVDDIADVRTEVVD